MELAEVIGGIFVNSIFFSAFLIGYKKDSSFFAGLDESL